MLSLQLYRKLRRKSILEDASSFFPTGWTARRSLDLDAADREYEISGGVHFVRVELYRRLLAGLEPNPATDAYVAALLAALKLNVGPARSREEFVADSSAQLDALREMRPQLTGASSTLFKAAEAVLELRTADALLRLLREKLLLSAKILEQAESHWRERVVSSTRLGRLRRRLARSAVVARDREQLARAAALLSRSLLQIGEVQRLLLTRPAALVPAALVDPKAPQAQREAAAAAEPEEQAAEAAAAQAADLGFDDEWAAAASEWTRAARTLIASTVGEIVHSVTSELAAAAAAASEEQQQQQQQLVSEVEEGVESSLGAREKRAAAAAAEKLANALPKVEAEPLAESVASTEANVERLDEWSSSGTGEGYHAALSLVHGLPQAQRVQRSLLPGYAYIYGKYAKVPQSVAQLAFAAVIHAVLKPRWEEISNGAATLKEALHGIWMARFYNPLSAIVQDLLNKKKLTNEAAFSDAEGSLDSMLRDFTGNKRNDLNRTSALNAVSRAYENELRKNPLQNLIGGKILRLVLIQAQVLKFELLKAMGAIDGLVDANRLNIQLLASVPAVILLIIGGRVFTAPVYWLARGKMRSLRDVHHEMGEALEKMERCLVLSGAQRPQPLQKEVEAELKTKATGWWWWGWGRKPPAELVEEEEEEEASVMLRGEELGEFTLLVHSFLLLLDFTSPPFSSKACDALHHEVQDLLWQGELSPERQLALLGTIRRKHAALARSYLR